jgi:hypothetical protein
MGTRIFLFSFLSQKYILALLICFYSVSVVSQDLEPRAYASVPKGINVLAVGYGFNRGNVLTDPALPIKDFILSTQSLGINYIHSFSISKKLARVQVSLPFADMQGKLTKNGEEITGSRSGMADMRIRFGINLTGSPALARKDFRQYQEKAIFGISFVTSVPTGRYYDEKMINLGSNRWAFKPEMGVSRRFKNVYAEAYLGTWFYTDNTEYLTNKVLKQKPTVTLQGHASYYFKNQMWVGVNTNWYKVGETTIDGVVSSDLMNDWRVGATYSVPISKMQALRLQFHTGLMSNLGLNYDSVTLAYQYVFY